MEWTHQAARCWFSTDTRASRTACGWRASLTRLLSGPWSARASGDAGQVDTACSELDEAQQVATPQPHRVDGQEAHAITPWARARRNARHEGPERRGTGGSRTASAPRTPTSRKPRSAALGRGDVVLTDRSAVVPRHTEVSSPSLERERPSPGRSRRSSGTITRPSPVSRPARPARQSVPLPLPRPPP
jgi:hypothetical protein